MFHAANAHGIEDHFQKMEMFDATWSMCKYATPKILIFMQNVSGILKNVMSISRKCLIPSMLYNSRA